MAARRCTRCARNYRLSVVLCPDCGDQLQHDEHETPDPHSLAAGANRASQTETVELWRLHELIRAGYPVDVAELFAARASHDLDLHHAVQLLENGCPVELATEILL